MTEKYFHINYRFVPATGQLVEFKLGFDNRIRLLPTADPEQTPTWTALEHHRCSNCPLDPAQEPPAAPPPWPWFPWWSSSIPCSPKTTSAWRWRPRSG